MMRIKTTNLTARSLDWAVGVAVGKPLKIVPRNGEPTPAGIDDDDIYSPTTNWGQLGPLIEAHKVQLVKMCSRNSLTSMWHSFVCDGDGDEGYFDVDPYSSLAEHEDIKIAACRAIVYSKLGDQVDVPEVLCQGN